MPRPVPAAAQQPVQDGQPAVRDGIKICWTFDERINDGFYCASSLKGVQAIVEDPARFIGT